MNEAARDIDDDEGERDAVEPQPAPAPKRSSHRFKVFRRRVGRGLSISVGAPALRTLARTWNQVAAGEEHLAAARAHGGGYFMALWHGRMLIPAARHGQQGYTVLVSPSGDGDVSEMLLRKLGYGVVRGSTSRRGRTALRELLTLLRAGTPIAITPDGPRGPRKVMSQGLAWMASATGFPVVPCGFVGANTWHLRSWDRFTIPKPFSRVAYVYEAPVFVDRKSAGGLESASETIRLAMERAERRGFELLGAEPDG